MGRKKIQISRITDERNRQVTFNKRKFGVMKKAYELSVLCDCEIALIIFSSSNKLYQYASTDMDKVLLKYTEYNEPHESLTNKNIIEKEHKGAMSPESPEQDVPEFNLTPRTEAKYAKIDEDFQTLIRANNQNGSRVMGQTSYTLPVTVPVNTYGEHMLGSSPQMAHTSISPRPSSSETDSVYPGGNMLDMTNGYPASASPLGGSPSPGPSPVALGVPAAQKGTRHSPQPPLPPANHPHRGNLRVVIPAPISQQMTTDDPSYDMLKYFQTGHNQTLNTPVVALQTPSVPTNYTGYGQTEYTSELSNLSWSHHRYVDDLSMYSTAQLTGLGQSLPHLGVSSNTPPPSTSPGVKIKSEPISPPRDASNNSAAPMHLPGHSNLGIPSSTQQPQVSPSSVHSVHSTQQQMPPQQQQQQQTLNLVSSQANAAGSRPSSNPPPSSMPPTPTNLPSPSSVVSSHQAASVVVSDMRAAVAVPTEYEANGPTIKRQRITEGWAT
ncbi:myocyte-specific enhancer factor 2 isoform X2 [Trichogramma pretiosum]|uniref:myocyte-specific enhancer factor 2 isoform X2 n=1 Tax=Trichogramma pretiosum TaxID=7493 RepID=UPI0006C9E396|nr:myocyte-specific enhancer factor 2 isoform X2 [Trichogramma pretiosum]